MVKRVSSVTVSGQVRVGVSHDLHVENRKKDATPEDSHVFLATNNQMNGMFHKPQIGCGLAVGWLLLSWIDDKLAMIE